MINWNNPNLALRQSNGLEAKYTGEKQPNGWHIVLLAMPGGGYDAQPYMDNGLPANENKPRVEQVIARPDARPMRKILDETQWKAGDPIPLKTPDRKPGTFRRINRMNPVAGRGYAFQIVGTYPTKLLGIVPFNASMFWNDNGEASGRGPDIDTSGLKWREVES